MTTSYKETLQLTDLPPQTDDLEEIHRHIENAWAEAIANGAIHFDPRNDDVYQEKVIGKFIKRIIPDRFNSTSETLSVSRTSVFLPFEYKASGYDYTMADKRQRIISLVVENKRYEVLASNSPLTKQPHTLLIPADLRPQFILREDIQVIKVLLQNFPEYSFLFSSLGAGAGVNHQHVHMIAGKEAYPALNIKLEPIGKNRDVIIHQTEQWPSNCLVLSGDKRQSFLLTELFIQVLQQHNIPHNLFFEEDKIWINPRSRISPSIIPGKKFGTWETILGICNCCSWEEYHQTDHAVFEKALLEILLSKKMGDALLSIITNLSMEEKIT